MYGRRRRALSAQLALMDAIVFFLVAISVSSIMFYYANGFEDGRNLGDPDDRSDPDVVLTVFLHASLGKEVRLDMNGVTRIAADVEIAECILVELEALSLGVEEGLFEPLNIRLMTILDGTCSSLVSPYVTAVWLHEGMNEVLLEMPGVLPHSRTIYTSSVVLPSTGESAFVLTLALVPAPLPETVDI